MRARDDLLLVAADPARLGRLLKWEHAPSRGEDFPHLYGVLLTSAVLWSSPSQRCARRFHHPGMTARLVP